VARIRFFLDENIPIAVAEQLQRRGIDAVTVRDLGLLGESDRDHMRRASEMGRVFCTHDADIIELAVAGIEHAGVVFGQQHKHSIGDWVRFLELITAVYEPQEMENRIEYL
jgi:hypothetical protein